MMAALRKFRAGTLMLEQGTESRKVSRKIAIIKPFSDSVFLILSSRLLCFLTQFPKSVLK
jgi:hypothetical protein